MCDWNKAKRDYITSTKTYDDIAEEYGVSRYAVTKHGKAEGWVTDRENYQTELTEKVLQKTAEKISDDQSELAASLNKSALQFAQRVHDRLIDPGEIKPMDLLRLAQVWQILHDSITKDKDVDEEQVGGIVMMVDRTEEDEN